MTAEDTSICVSVLLMIGGEEVTRTRAQLRKQLTNFQESNSFSDKEVAEMLQTTSLTVFRIKKGLVEWVDFKLLKRLTMLMGE